MAVYTQIADDDLRSFLADYDVGELHSYKGIAEGVQNTNYLVRTSKTSYILTLYEKLVETKDLPFFLGLMEHLATHDISCPLPVEDKNGQVLKTLSGCPAVMVTFLDGFSVNRPKRAHCAGLGTALGAMHIAGADFEMARPNTLAVGDWRPLFEKCGDGVDNIHPGLHEVITAEMAFLENNWPKDLPTGIIHADLFPDNVFFLDDNLSGLIDFYFACNDFLSYDLAVCLNAWCFESDCSFNMTNARALLSGYEQTRPLQEQELQALPLLARGAALRFLLTRIYDWINTPADALVNRHDPREYLRKLLFHQQIKNVSEYGFGK
ncbi:MAG: homoserine kinase [bacterium]|nr:homoserine kinase [bacterium]